jgi:bifunctional non-homologous end joining protein LigD
MIEPMLLKSCKDRNLTKYEGGFTAQRKYDGTRIIAQRDESGVTLQTRSGKNELSKEYPDIVDELKLTHIRKFILDGELVFFRKLDGKEEFLTGLAVETRKDYDVKFIVFDILEYNDINMRTHPQYKRDELLFTFFDVNSFKNVQQVVTYKERFNELFDTVIASGGEGIVLKKKTAVYKDGKRSAEWLKVKKQDTADCFIVGMMEGDGKNAEKFGSLILAQYNKDSQVMVVCNCSGFTDQQREDFYQSLIKEPWAETFPSTKGELSHIVHKVAPKVVVEIEFMERLPSGSVRHPRFIRIRTDKQPKDCIYEE